MSLRSIIRKGRFFYNWEQTPEAREDYGLQIVSYAMSHLASPDTILVNAQSVLDDILPGEHIADKESVLVRALDFEAVPRPMPPFEYMWLESTIRKSDQRIGVLVRRAETGTHPAAFIRRMGIRNEDLERQIIADNPVTIVNAAVFHDHEGSAVYTGGVCYWLDAEGNFIYSIRQFPPLFTDDEKRQKRQIFALKMREAWILQTFARLNCKNVKLRPINEGKVPAHAPNKLVPASVWHEIVVTSVPKSISGGRDVLNPGKENEIRAHWIRGHYADYRKGAGLFGNPKLKGLFWIPEHRRGNEELGQVIPEYTIQ